MENGTHLYRLTTCYDYADESRGSNPVEVEVGANGVDLIVDDILIVGDKGKITISNADNRKIDLYTIDGVKIETQTGGKETVSYVSAGLYIERLGDFAKKVLVL